MKKVSYHKWLLSICQIFIKEEELVLSVCQLGMGKFTEYLSIIYNGEREGFRSICQLDKERITEFIAMDAIAIWFLVLVFL